MSPGFATVRVTPAVRDTYLSLVTDSVLPEGTIVALFFADEAGREAGPVFAMEKQSGTWRYFSTDARGGLDPRLNAGECARCHEAAPADSVFGLPRSASPASSPVR